MGLYKNAMKYGYSNTRVKAMESKLIDSTTMGSISEAKDIDSIVSILFQTDYNASITKFGGLEISTIMLDFAISDNLAVRVNRLAEITPKSDQHIIRKLIARWDLGNLKLALEAVDRNKPFDSISRYMISSSIFSPQVLRDFMKQDITVEAMLTKLMRSTPTYKAILGNALLAYKKTKNVIDAISTIDMQHYKELGELSAELTKGKDKSSELLKMDIDMRNIITMLRAKKKGMKFSEIAPSIINNGIEIKVLSKNYSSAEDVIALAAKMKIFDLRGATEVYKESGQLLAFEIGMRNQIFNESRKLLRASVLTLGSLVDYIYLKEIEVFTLRALIKSKEYGLSKEEISRLVVWNL